MPRGVMQNIIQHTAKHILLPFRNMQQLHSAVLTNRGIGSTADPDAGAGGREMNNCAALILKSCSMVHGIQYHNPAPAGAR